jgi:hypothetical protein
MSQIQAVVGRVSKREARSEPVGEKAKTEIPASLKDSGEDVCGVVGGEMGWVMGV